MMSGPVFCLKEDVKALIDEWGEVKIEYKITNGIEA